MDPEYAVIGRVARRIWARAMRERYGAGAAQPDAEVPHPDLGPLACTRRRSSSTTSAPRCRRCTRCSTTATSLHTNAYDEAITTPTEESVRRAVAIQMIINQELGLNFNENPWQGSFIVDKLTDLVEEAVYKEFEAISERGGVLGAMDTMYQRGKIQEEIAVLRAQEARRLAAARRRQHLPAEGTRRRHRHRDRADPLAPKARRASRSTTSRATSSCATTSRRPRRRGRLGRSASGNRGLAYLQKTARDRQNVFAALMEAVKTHSLGQISHALYDVGGEYRRNM